MRCSESETRPRWPSAPGHLMIVHGFEWRSALRVPGQTAGRHVVQERDDTSAARLPDIPLVLVLDRTTRGRCIS